MLALLRGQSSINLAELACAIAADRALCRRVLESAMQEFGWPVLTVEQAIVLLGRERLAAQLLRIPNLNCIAQPAIPGPPAPFQGKQE